MIISAQTISIIVMFCSGVAIGAVVDSFRLYWLKRRQTKLYKIHRVFEVVLFSLLGVLTFFLLFKIKGGAWRFVDPLAQLLGIYMYSVAFKPIFRLVGAVIHFIFVRPIIWLSNLLFAILRFPVIIIIAIVKRIVKMIKKKRKVL
jgi:hypothetical protein